MSSYIDNRTTTTSSSSSTSFLFSTQPPTSPTIQQQALPQQEDIYLDYLNSPKPTSSARQQQQQTVDENSKRRSSAASSSSSSSLATFQPLVITSPKIVKFESSKKKQHCSKKSFYKREKLKEAKNEYEERIEEYYQQLTVGCQQIECRNKFCASGKGGILSLNPQAAIVMSIQLASMPGSRLCTITNNHASTTIKKKKKHIVSRKEQQGTAKPFLTSLFTSATFMSLLGHDGELQVEEDQEEDIESVTSQASFTWPLNTWSKDFWKWFSHSKIEQVTKQQTKTETEEEYYQIDGAEEESNSINNLLLAIPPLAITFNKGLEYLHKAIVLNNMSDEKVDLFCRSIFQSWEGIGNSFLKNDALCLADLTQFYQLVTQATKNARQRRIMYAISDNFETLLDRMILNVENIQDLKEWTRSIMAIMLWILCIKESHKKDGYVITRASSTTQHILLGKLISVLSKMTRIKQLRIVMRDKLSQMDPSLLERLVQDLHCYLLDHFHTGPYKHGLEDTVIMTLKCLELFYQVNMKQPTKPIISNAIFYSEEICKKLNIKNEYRIWKRVLMYGEGRHSTLISRQSETEHQRRSRLFMTSSHLLPRSSSWPFENDYQFSWFSYPFLLPPAMKRKIVLMDAMSQMSLEYEDACVNHTLVVHAQKLLSEAPKMLKNLETSLKNATCPYLLLEIRREHFVADTLDQLSKKWSDLKKPLKVKFVHGGEEGMDQGGVQKEFFGVLFEKLVSQEMGLFTQDPSTRLCWIRPVFNHDIRLYEMIGVMMGLSVYNGVMMNLQFPKVLWKVLVMPNEALIDVMVSRHQLFTLEDLEEGWPDLGHGLRQLLTWAEGEVEDIFCRDYEISMDVFGQGVVTRSLMSNPDMAPIPVTNENRDQYVKDYCTWFMYTAQKQQILALRRGLWSVIGSRAVNLCTAEELEMVACGLRDELNMKELESVAEYDDGYNVHHPTIKQFWAVVHHDLSNEQKKQLLLFVTASDRVPVGGLKELSFYIQRNGPDSDRLPTALTCFSRLLLPEYANRIKLKDRLITAIENTKGFGLV